MSILKNVFKIAIKPNTQVVAYCTNRKKIHRPLVGNLIWNKPEPLPFNHPAHTGDLDSFEVPSMDTIRYEFQKSEILKNANEEVKKVFSLRYLDRKHYYKIYEKQLVDKVKNNEYDRFSLEVLIAIYTAKTRFYRYCCDQEPTNSKYKIAYYYNLDKRYKYLKILRLKDYKKFEWILDQLNIVFRPYARTKQVTRKNSVRALATIRTKTEIEKKRVELEKIFDDQKIPFLEKKIEKLNWIIETEKANNLPSTVTELDVEHCRKKIEEVKINLSEKIKNGYEKKIDPNTLEFYNEKLLLEKEKSNI